MIKLINVYDELGAPVPNAIEHLWELLAERKPSESISHKAMPSFEGHEAFVRSRPYCEWYMVGAPYRGETALVGAIYATYQNEIGIAIRRQFQGVGHASEAIKAFMLTHKPLPGVTGKRPDKFIAHVAPGNVASRHLFEGLGARQIQVTYEL